MSGNYWIKLYHEILDDPKMATLPDRLWRRVIELFLIAGRLYEDGDLPETNQIAWALRMNTDDLAMDMAQISSTGIVEKTVTGWRIPKFVERQAAKTDAERSQAYRERKNKQQYYGNRHENVTESVTLPSRNVTQITDNRLQITDNRVRDAAVFKKYQSEIGFITKVIADKVKIAIDEYPEDWILQAIDEAVVHNARKWGYIEAILKNWKVNGFKNKKPSEDAHMKFLLEQQEKKEKEIAERNKYLA